MLCSLFFKAHALVFLKRSPNRNIKHFTNVKLKLLILYVFINKSFHEYLKKIVFVTDIQFCSIQFREADITLNWLVNQIIVKKSNIFQMYNTLNNNIICPVPDLIFRSHTQTDSISLSARIYTL